MVQKRLHRVSTAATRASLRTGAELPVFDLSLGGACLGLAEVLPGRERVRLALHHPHLPAPTALEAEVVWSRRVDCDAAAGTRARAGVRFVRLDPAERRLVRRCMLAEYGHAVFDGDAVPDPGPDPTPPQRPVGYLVQEGAGAWGFYDPDVRKVADLARDEDRLLLTRPDRGPAPVPSADAAAARVFDLASPARIDPPPSGVPQSDLPQSDLPQSDAPRGPLSDAQPYERAAVAGSAVLVGGAAIGYVARTGEEEWSFFDADREPLGFMTLGAYAWRIVLLGANPDGSLDLRRADDYPAAVAAAFGLAEPPELRSSVFAPARLLEAT